MFLLFQWWCLKRRNSTEQMCSGLHQHLKCHSKGGGNYCFSFCVYKAIISSLLKIQKRTGTKSSWQVEDLGTLWEVGCCWFHYYNLLSQSQEHNGLQKEYTGSLINYGVWLIADILILKFWWSGMTYSFKLISARHLSFVLFQIRYLNPPLMYSVSILLS